MNTDERISSILNACALHESLIGMRSFDLRYLSLEAPLTFMLPTRLRLGHLAEKVVAEALRASPRFLLMYESVQLIDHGRTLGEIDFVIRDHLTSQVTHIELAYKFYLYDPHVADSDMDRWIGPNRKDSLSEKLQKVSMKQFPLLHHPQMAFQLPGIDLEEVEQALCLLAMLYLPYDSMTNLSPLYDRTICGYYVTYDQFVAMDQPGKRYYLPKKLEWGMDPSKNDRWRSVADITDELCRSMEEKRSRLCWQSFQGDFISFFVVWWS